ncbi:MAG TPA: hypothetical protein PK200_06905 [Spirochaetota bacterium]|nr:hypothetical protein [Spirochaetota bacterium]HQO02051.1 hypothetical protein [Spirochaetota bacterium]HQP47581.1 hypothetical protein [Spirochaetota bacterium]
MIDYEFIEIQKQRMIEYIENHLSCEVTPTLENEISRIMFQIAMNENRPDKKPGKPQR